MKKIVNSIGWHIFWIIYSMTFSFYYLITDDIGFMVFHLALLIINVMVFIKRIERGQNND